MSRGNFFVTFVGHAASSVGSAGIELNDLQNRIAAVQSNSEAEVYLYPDLEPNSTDVEDELLEEIEMLEQQGFVAYTNPHVIMTSLGRVVAASNILPDIVVEYAEGRRGVPESTPAG